MAKNPVLRDREAGKEVFVHKDADGYTVEQKQHVKHIIERNKQARDAWQPNQMIGNTQRHHQQVAEIPNVLTGNSGRDLGRHSKTRKIGLSG